MISKIFKTETRSFKKSRAAVKLERKGFPTAYRTPTLNENSELQKALLLWAQQSNN